MDPRLLLAFLLQQSTKGLSRLLGRDGTALPGAMALKFDPNAIKKVRARLEGAILVTGTNGKTTTTRILSEIAREAGFQVITNSLGANMRQGIATALLDRLPELRNAKKAQKAIGVIEVDEATLPKVIEDLDPDAVVVTNFFRDQMDRYAELDHVVAKVKGALDRVPKARRVLNADDPLVRSLEGEDTLFYGFSPENGESQESDPSLCLDGQTCKSCGSRLDYRVRFYGQLGDYRCACGFHRPTPEVEAGPLTRTREGFAFDVLGHRAGIQSPGRYNVYNALAAVAGAHALRWNPDAVGRAIASIKTDIGRMERLVNEAGKEVLLTLVKNPMGLNQVLDVVATDPEETDFLMILNDQAADGRDVSWIWDASLEKLDRSRFGTVLVSGLRAHDLAVRLKYAGLTGIDVEEDPFRAAERMTKPGRPLHLLTTYTSLYALRDHLFRKGFHHA